MKAITDVKLSHGDTLMCQIWYAESTSKHFLAKTQIHGENIILI